MATWEPKYDFAVPESETSRRLKEDRGLAGVVGEEWVPAPPSSHCEAFLFLDNRKPQHELLESSLLHVRFKAKGKQPAKEYVYEFRDTHGGAAEGAAVFDALCAAASPWAEVGLPRLVNAKVPYSRRS